MGQNRSKAINEKDCSSCGEIIKIRAEVCPWCGVQQLSPVNKPLLLIITFFLGFLGGHKFYLGKPWLGITFLLLCWTGIPGVIALIEFIIYALTSTERLQEKYSGSSSGMVVAIVACGMVCLAVAGIMAAIAVPNYVAYRHKELQDAVQTELQTLMTAEYMYFIQHGIYTIDLQELNMPSNSSKVKIEIIFADEKCFKAIGKHPQFKDDIVVDCNGIH